MQTYLPDLVGYLEDNLKGYSQERKTNKRLIAKILFFQRQHWQDESALAISDSFLRKIGHSPASFKKVNDRYNFYTPEGGYVRGLYARKWYPNPIVNFLVHGYIKSEQSKVVREIIKRSDGSLCERTAEFIVGSSVIENGLVINPIPKVDTQALLDYMQNTPNLNDHHKNLANRIFALMGAENVPRSCIPQSYHTPNNGRVVGLGISLQFVPKGMRKALLKGYYEYDLANCHYSIMSQTGTYPTINDYVANTKEWRNEIAERVGITYEEAKRCLLALSYGATRGLNENFCAIPAMIGAEKAMKFWNDKSVEALAAETRIAGANLVGMKPTDKDLASKVALRLQSIENQILAAAAHGLIIDVPIFDAFIYHDKLDVETLQKNVKEITGYDVIITEECL